MEAFYLSKLYGTLKKNITFEFFQVPGKFVLKGHNRIQGLSSLNVHNENQYIPGQSRNTTYVSRLQVQCMHVHNLSVLEVHVSIVTTLRSHIC